MFYLFLLTLSIFLIVGILYLQNQLKKLKKRELEIIDAHVSTQKTIQQMIHDVKNPLATLAMAIHNLQLAGNSVNQDLPEDSSLTEIYETIAESVKDTTNRLNETAIFCRSGRSHFRAVDAISFIENNLPGTEKPVKVITDFPQNLPPIDADQQALDLAIQMLLSLCKYKSSEQLIIHISVSEMNLIHHTIEYKFYNHKLLSSNLDVNRQNSLHLSTADEHTQFILSAIQTILARHNSKLMGRYNPDDGSIFTFQLKAVTG